MMDMTKIASAVVQINEFQRMYKERKVGADTTFAFKGLYDPQYNNE
jgi:hypothetical protein